MPYKTVYPVPESMMLEEDEVADNSDMRKKRWLGHHTICETLREIWRITKDEEIKYKCRMAMAYAKKMNAKLKYYSELNQTAEETNDGKDICRSDCTEHQA